MRESLLSIYRSLFARGWASRFNYFVLDCGLRGLGVMNHGSDHSSGERYLINDFLPEKVGQSPVLFDVGANVGNYSAALIQRFPEARVFAFEPNPTTFSRLRATHGHRVDCQNLALSDVPGEISLYDRQGSQGTEHASVYGDVISQIHGIPAQRTAITATTIDLFCEQNGIVRIDFLKIDTEGHELGVASGASRMISEDRIGVIQVEFNEMNLISRTFCRDLRQKFPRHIFYRLLPAGLLPMSSKPLYSELFGFQNLVGLRSQS